MSERLYLATTNAAGELVLPGNTATVGSDGTVGGPGGSPLSPSMVTDSRIRILPAPSGGDDSAVINPIIAGLPEGSKVMGHAGTYMMNSAPLVLVAGLDYDFTLSTFSSAQGSAHPLIVNKAALSSSIFASASIATDVTTVGNTYEVDSLVTEGAPTGGTFTSKFTWGPVVSTTYTSTAIKYNATATEVETALLAAAGPYGQPLPYPEAGLSCSGGPLGTAPVVITFASQLIGPVTSFAVASNNLTGGTSPKIAVSRSTEGKLGSATITSPKLIAAGATVGMTVQVAAAGPSPNPPNLTGKITEIKGNEITLGNDYGPVFAHQTIAGTGHAYLIKRDANIRWRGGMFNRTDTAEGSTYFDAAVGVFRHADRLAIADVNVSCVIDKQTFNLGDVCDWSIEKHYQSNTGDGIHINGNSFRGTISGTKGSTGDDFVCMSGRGYTANEDTAGNIIDVRITDTKQTTGAGINLIAGAGCQMLHVTVDGMYGLCHQAAGTQPIRLYADNATYGQCGGGIFDDIVLRDIRPTVSGYAAATILVNTLGVQNLTVDGFYSNTTGTVEHNNALIYCQNDPNGRMGSVASFTLSKAIVAGMKTSEYAVGFTNCALGKMTITSARFVLNGSQHILLFAGTTVCGKVLISDVHAENLTSPTSGGYLIRANGSGMTVPDIQVSNFRGDALSALIDCGITTTIKVANVELTNNSQGAAFVRSTGNLRIVGGPFTGSSTSIGSEAGGVWSVDCQTLQTDATKLTPQLGDIVYNNNSALPAGVGKVIWDSSYVSLNGAALFEQTFAGGVSGFTAKTGNVLSSTETVAYTGSKSAEITCGGTNEIYFQKTAPEYGETAVTPGKQYTFTTAVRAKTTTRLFRIRVQWWNAEHKFLSYSEGANVSDSASVWTKLTFNVVAPAGATTCVFIVLSTTVPASTEVHYIGVQTIYESTVGIWRPLETPYFASGTAKLEAGSVVVPSAIVTANPAIRCTTDSPGGTVGTPYVSAKSAGTSFTIASTSGADTSTIYWELVTP